MSAHESPGGDEGAVSKVSKGLNLSEVADVGSWAALMQDEQPELGSRDQDLIDENDENARTLIEDGEDQEDGGRRQVFHGSGGSRFYPPYICRIKNVPHHTCEEDLFFHFGGEKSVRDMLVRKDNADIEFLTEDAMIAALKLSEMHFMGRTIYVKPSRDYLHTSAPRRHSQRHDSQSSHFSTDSRRQSNRYSGRESYGNERGYHSGGVGYDHDRDRMPPPNFIPSRGPRGSDRYRDRRDYDSGYSRDGRNQNGPGFGGGPSFRGGRGGYNSLPRGGQSHGYGRQDCRYGDDRGLQRSTSHQFDAMYDRPGSVARSRTDSMSSHMTQSERRSEDHPQVKKPSSKDIFGDAKPVDTRQREMEIEEKLRKEKEDLRQQEQIAKNEAAAAAALQGSQVGQVPQYPQFPYVHAPNQRPHHGHAQYPHGSHHHPRRSYHPEASTPPLDTHEHYTRDTGSPFDGPPGSVAILGRPSLPKEDTDAHSDSSPPLDPVHPPPVIEDESEGVSDDKTQFSDSSKIRTFTRGVTLQKSQTIGSFTPADASSRGGFVPRGRGRGRGGARGGAATAREGRRGSFDGQKRHKQFGERKDSISSRGTTDGGRGRGGKRGGGPDRADEKSHTERQTAERKSSLPAKPSKSEENRAHSKDKKDKPAANKEAKDTKVLKSETKMVEVKEKEKVEKKNSGGDKEKDKDGGQEKEKSKKGEVGSKKREKEEKKKLQSMPKLKTTTTTFSSSNKFSLLGDLD